MITPTGLVDILFETFDKSAVEDLRRFLATNPDIKKWQIAADYCLHDKDRPNNVFAFSIIPYDTWIDVQKADIRQALPKDLKKTKTIDATASKFLINKRRFHIGFVLERDVNIFATHVTGTRLQAARESIAMTLEHVVAQRCSEERVKRFKKLRQESQAKNFNIELLSDLYILSYLFCFISLIIARERTSETIGWFSDRDNMTTWCDGILWDMGQESLYGMAEHYEVNVPGGMPLVAVPDPSTPGVDPWYDELIRLPDYLAGILAAWDFKENRIPGDKLKYGQLARNVIANAENLVVLRLGFGERVECARLMFDKLAENPAVPIQ